MNSKASAHIFECQRSILVSTLVVLIASGCDFAPPEFTDTVVSKAIEAVLSAPMPMESHTFRGTSDDVKNIRTLIEALHKEGYFEVRGFNYNQYGNELSVAMSITETGRSEMAGTVFVEGEKKAVFRLGRRSIVRNVETRNSEIRANSTDEPRCEEFVINETPTELGQRMRIKSREFRARAIVKSDRFQGKDIVLKVEAGELGLNGWKDISWLDEQGNMQHGLRQGFKLKINPCSA